MQNSEDIARQIRRYMADHPGTTNADVAAIVGLKRQAFYRRMKGETPWRLAELQWLSHRLNINFTENGTNSNSGR